MEYLVTMTTHVPEGTSEEAVAEMRAREAAHSRELAAQGHLLRLWRPPLRPGEWRTLGLFTAEDGAELEKVLVSMPLRVWRTDQVTPLSPHPHDPAPPGAGREGAQEFLVALTVTAGAPPDVIDEAMEQEAVRARTLAEQGHLVRLWRLTSRGAPLSLWRAEDSSELQRILGTLPLAPWLTAETTPLGPHPNDPASAQG